MKKEQNGRILGLLLASSDSTLLVTKLAGKAVKVTRRLWGVKSAEKGNNKGETNILYAALSFN